jgi:hypothetical protein
MMTEEEMFENAGLDNYKVNTKIDEYNESLSKLDFSNPVLVQSINFIFTLSI